MSLDNGVVPAPPLHSPPRKKGCGCFLTGCLGSLLILALLFAGAGIGTYYAFKNADVADDLVLWTYNNVARPKIVELLPPNMSTKEKERVLKMADGAVQEYISLSPAEKSVLLKEAAMASWYISQDKTVPPDKIPNLTKFIEGYVQNYQGVGR